jgi:hypothetical protein
MQISGSVALVTSAPDLDAARHKHRGTHEYHRAGLLAR